MADVLIFVLLDFLMVYCCLSKVCPGLFKTLKEQCSNSALIYCWWVAKCNSNKFFQANDIDAFFGKISEHFFLQSKTSLRSFAEMVPWEWGKAWPDQLGFILECAISVRRRGSLQLGGKLQLWRKSTHDFFSLPFLTGRKDLHNY